MKKKLLLSALLSSLLCTSLSAATHAQMAKEAFEGLFAGNPKPFEMYTTQAQYKQHNLALPDGRDAILALVPSLKGGEITIHRILTDGDFVILHRSTKIGEKRSVVFDILRFKEGKIVEHWDNITPLAKPNPSNRTQTDGETTIKDKDKTAENKKLVTQFVKDVLLGENLSKIASYYDGDRYIQHNSDVADGLSSLGKALAEGIIKSKYVKLHAVFGEGNFVLAVGEATLDESTLASYDLFRVENGKIAEHWDVLAPIPPKNEHKNPNGKFGF